MKISGDVSEKDIEIICRHTPGNGFATLAGFLSGIACRLVIGSQAYKTPGGAVGIGLSMTYTDMHIQKEKPGTLLLNVFNAEAGYYAGVFATEYLINHFRG